MLDRTTYGYHSEVLNFGQNQVKHWVTYVIEVFAEL